MVYNVNIIIEVMIIKLKQLHEMNNVKIIYRQYHTIITASYCW